MVAMSDITKTLPESQTDLQEGVCPLVRAGARFSGAILVLASVGIWLVPGTPGDAVMVFMKLLVSVLFAITGMVLVQNGRQGVTDEVHLDTERAELRHVQRGCDGIARIRARFSFDDLADIRLSNGMLTVIANSGAVLVQLPADDVENLQQLRHLLGRTLAKST